LFNLGVAGLFNLGVRIQFSVTMGNLPPPTITFQSPVTVASVDRTLDPSQMCSSMLAPWLKGAGVTAEGGAFHYAYTESRFEVLAGGCQFTGRTRVVDVTGGEKDATPIGILAQTYSTNRYHNSSVGLALRFTSGALLIPPIVYGTNVDIVGRTSAAQLTITSSSQSGRFISLTDDYSAAVLSSSSNNTWMLHWLAP